MSLTVWSTWITSVFDVFQTVSLIRIQFDHKLIDNDKEFYTRFTDIFLTDLNRLIMSDEACFYISGGVNK